MTTTINHLHMGCGESLRSSIWRESIKIKVKQAKKTGIKNTGQDIQLKDKKRK